MDRAVTALLAIVSGIIGLAILSVLVSKQAQTPQVLAASGSALSQVIGAATAPVTGTGAASGGSSGLFGSLGSFSLGNISSLFGG